MATLLLMSAVAMADPAVPGLPGDPGVTAAQRYITATGVGEAGVSSAFQATMLNVGVHQQVNGEPAKAIEAVKSSVDAIRAAMVKVGVPATSIQVQNFNIYPIYGGPMPLPEPVPGSDTKPATPPNNGQPTIQGYNVDENLTIETTSPEQLAQAMEVAVKAGATSVNTYMKGGETGTPDAATLSAAVQKATQQAKALAEASATAAGLKLGPIHNINIQPPYAWYNGPGIGSWRVNVMVTYEVAQ